MSDQRSEYCVLKTSDLQQGESPRCEELSDSFIREKKGRQFEGSTPVKEQKNRNKKNVCWKPSNRGKMKTSAEL